MPYAPTPSTRKLSLAIGVWNPCNPSPGKATQERVRQRGVASLPKTHVHVMLSGANEKYVSQSCILFVHGHDRRCHDLLLYHDAGPENKRFLKRQYHDRMTTTDVDLGGTNVPFSDEYEISQPMHDHGPYALLDHVREDRERGR